MYLRDVEEGGETKFPQLGVSVKPRKGLALIWNSMNSRGECDPTSLHNAAKVIKGHKFIIQRWLVLLCPPTVSSALINNNYHYIYRNDPQIRPHVIPDVNRK